LEINWKIRDKVVLITGASAGFGEATALQFAAHGSKLIIAARRLQKLEHLKRQIEDKHPGTRVHAAELDVCSEQSVKHLVANLPIDLQAIDILVNNAGLALGLCKTWEVELDDYNRMMDTNVKGVLLMTKAFVPGMIERNSGHIINVSSIAGLETYANGSIYCASKFALNALNSTLRKELVGTNIRVCSICPGLAKTEFSLVRFKGDAEKAEGPYKGLDPLVAEDIADTILYVASRPPHVQIAEMVIFPTNQASVSVIHRV